MRLTSALPRVALIATLFVATTYAQTSSPAAQPPVEPRPSPKGDGRQPPPAPEKVPTPDELMLRRIYDTALVGGPAHDQLRELCETFPGRLAGSTKLVGAAAWARGILTRQGADRTELQPVMVPHWERGAPESVRIVNSSGGEALTATALGGSVPTPAAGLTATVVELHSLDELKTTDVKGKIVFFNRAMNPAYLNTGRAYGEAGDARNRGPAEAAKHGAVGVLTRSLTLAHDDVPHTGATTYLPDVPRIPAAALSFLASDRLAAALQANPALQVEIKIHSQWFGDSPAFNVLGELRGSEHPEQIIAVGGHLDSWDIAPGAHDDGSGVIQSIEVLRIFKALGYTPRHTIRCVLFANEENGLRGAMEYARIVGEKKEEHLLALETDNGGFQPKGFNLGNPAGDAHLRAARWKELFEPYGILVFQHGSGGADVSPLLRYGYTVAGLTPDSQRYFDYHHTATDSIDKVNPRELELGAAAMAALIYLIDQHGL
ncbi:MAG: M20/M25/M40 family metallo-hydrolase [Opitutales bacterium]